LIFSALHRLQQRRLVAGDRERDALARPVEGGRKLGAVLYSDARRRSGAGINQPAARAP
jgi:hypothetical protein